MRYDGYGTISRRSVYYIALDGVNLLAVFYFSDFQQLLPGAGKGSNSDSENTERIAFGYFDSWHSTLDMDF